MSKQLNGMTTLFRALADETRLRILGLLLTGEVCVCDIQDSLRIPQPKASRHLAYLRRAGLVHARRDGLWIHYRLATPTDRAVTDITEAVRHALTSSEEVQKDIRRLQRSASCCVPTPTDERTGEPVSSTFAVAPVSIVRKNR